MLNGELNNNGTYVDDKVSDRNSIVKSSSNQ